MKEQELKDLFDKVALELEALGIPISKRISGIDINHRARKSLGACKIEKQQGKRPQYRIEISAAAAGCSETEICRIIAHELLHTCPGCFDHGKKWKEYGKIVEDSLGYKISRTIRYEELGIEAAASSEKVKYVVICPGCGQVYERRRMCPLIRRPWQYRCGRCGSALSGEVKSTTSCR